MCLHRVACPLCVLVGDFELVLDARMGLEYVVVDDPSSSLVCGNPVSGTWSVAVGRSGNSCKLTSRCSCPICHAGPTVLGRPSRTFRSVSLLASRLLPHINGCLNTGSRRLLA
jgi:hypothetical protein